MKRDKRIISTILVFLILISSFTCVPVMAAKKKVSYSAENNETTLRSGQYFIYRNVDFTPGFTSADFTTQMGTSTTTTITLKIDSIAGESITDTLTLEVDEIVPVWGVGTYNIPITKQVTGVHDVYFYIGSGEVNPPTLSFNYWEGSKVIYEPYSKEYHYNDEVVPDNYYKIDFLSDLGVFDKSKEYFDADLPVTRIDFIKALSNFYDETTASEVPISIFKDVKKEEDRKAAYFLYQKGVVILEDTAYLKPTEYITIYEAGEYIANMLGYSADSYYASKMTAGVKTADNHIRRKDMADILYNAVFESYRTIEHDYKGSYSYKEHNDGILYYTKKLYITEGVVTANNFTGVYSANDASSEEYVKIDNTRYLIGETKADRLLGIKCRVVYDEKDDIRTIKAIAPLYSDGILILDNQYKFKNINDSGISYLVSNNKEKTLKFNNKTRFIYNGKALDRTIKAVIPDASKIRGKVVLIDNNRDKIYDFCIITDAKSVIVKSISDEVLSDKITNDNTYFEENATVDFVNNGDKIDAGDIKIGTAVDLYESKSLSGSKLYTIRTGTTIEGQIVEKHTEGGETICTLSSGEKYKISPYAKTDIPMLQEGIFHINGFNEILYFEAASENVLTLGWAIGYAKSTDPFSDATYARIKSTDNKINDYTFAKRVIADGITIKDYNELINGKGSFVGLDNLEEQKPVLFRLNENNEITIIDTEQGTEESVYNQLTCIMPKQEYQYYYNKFFDQNLSLIAGRWGLGSACGFPDANSMKYTMSILDNEAYNTFSKMGWIGESIRQYTGYSFKKNSYTVDLIVYQTSESGGDYIRPVLITELSQVYKDEETVTKLTVLTYNGETTDYYINSDMYALDAEYRAAADTLKVGDLIAGCLESQSRSLTKITPLVFVDNKYDGNGDTRTNGSNTVTAAINTTSNFNNFIYEDKIIKGTVTNLTDEYIELTMNHYSEGVFEKVHTDIGKLANVKIYQVSEEGAVESGISSSALYEGQVLVAHYFEYGLSGLYIYDTVN